MKATAPRDSEAKKTEKKEGDKKEKKGLDIMYALSFGYNIVQVGPASALDSESQRQRSL